MFAFNVFGIIAIVGSAKGIFDVATSYKFLEPEEQSQCTEFLIWKSSLLILVILFFSLMAISVSVIQR